MNVVMIRVDLSNRPEGDPVVITGLGEFPNGEVSVVRMDVLAAYHAQNPIPFEEQSWPTGIEVLELDSGDLDTVFAVMTKKTKSDKAKAAAVPSKSEEGK